MKINPTALDTIPQDMVDRDHRFWSDFSTRTIGNWITYDTTIKDVCDFVRKVYVRHDYSDFKR